jgi:hypothetical protein
VAKERPLPSLLSLRRSHRPLLAYRSDLVVAHQAHALDAVAHPTQRLRVLPCLTTTQRQWHYLI